MDNVSAAVYVSEKDEAHKHGPSFHLLSYLKSALPSVHCLQCGRKGIRPVKTEWWGCWHGYLSGARCRLACGPADVTATHCLLLPVKSRLVLPFWYRLTRVVLEKGPLNGRTYVPQECNDAVTYCYQCSVVCVCTCLSCVRLLSVGHFHELC